MGYLLNIIELNKNANDENIMIEENKIKFLGRSDIQFTDEKGISYIIGSEMLASKKYDMVIFTKEIEPVDKKNMLNDEDKQVIISKLFDLTKGIKWLVK